MPKRMLVAVTTLGVLAGLPVLLIGALAVMLRQDLGFNETQLGAAVSLFAAISAVGSPLAGRLTERLGPYASMLIVAGVTTVALLGIAGLTTTYAHLLGWLALAGIANSLTVPSGNLAIARGMPPHRQGIAFGVKQSARPVAALLAGLSVPAIALTLGWRWVFAAAVLVAVVFVLVVPRPEPAAAHRRRSAKLGGASGGLLLLAVGAGCATAAGNSLLAFYVESAVSRGFSHGAAGLWLAAGSVIGILTRLASGWLADRREGGNLRMVAVLLVGGSAGLALLAPAESTAAIAVATVLTFSAGWGWMGLYQLSVVRRHPDAPATATGITQAGALTGAVLGPLGFGALVQYGSYTLAWSAAAVAMLVAGVLVQIERRTQAPRAAPASRG